MNVALENSNALITGASSGIGRSFTKILAQKGANLIIVARRDEILQNIKKELEEKYDTKIIVFQCDLADEKQIANLCEFIRENDIDLLINNAGFGTSKYFYEKDIEDEIKMIDVHDSATIRLIHAALPNMIDKDNGIIINVSSVAAYTHVAGNTTYGATKAFLNAFSLALQKELAGKNIKIQALCPGFTYSGFHDTEEYEKFDRNDIPSIFWMKSDKVAEISLKKLKYRKTVIIPGFMNHLVPLARRMPFFKFFAKIVIGKKDAR
ncbi:MAG: SDR family NAD(P)-dependent oxidoreductase [Candidatus Zixiibacteriota bacterium]